MTRRIVIAIMAVTVAAVGAFGIPLGAVIQQQYRSEAILELERQAAAAAIEVPADYAAEGEPLELPTADDGAVLAVYTPAGHKVAGIGPERGDGVIGDAADGGVADGRVGTDLVVAVPVASQERVFAVVRASQPEDLVRDRVERAWAAMAGLAVAVTLVAFGIAIGLARRLQRPVGQLVDAATILGSGDFSVRAQRSGIAELDRAAEALDSTALRIGAIVERERAFTTDASHQLRTPLTAMRVHLHQAETSEDRRPTALAHMGHDLDRLEQTTEDLLRLARDSDPRDAPVDLGALLVVITEPWQGLLTADGRRIAVHNEDAPVVRASPAAIRQILEVLIDNARQHGAGTISVTVREVGGGGAIDVRDEGTVEIPDAEAIFVRRSSDRPGHGIGLALARTLAEADGARLVLTDPGPGARFTLLFPGLPESRRQV